MILIVGLGNPGKKFASTRHNVGFLFLDCLEKLKEFQCQKEEKKFEAQIKKGVLFGKPVVLARPLTFMNESGRAVSKLKNYFKIPPQNIWIIHDDVSILLGKQKISKNRGPGGHKGVKSIIDSLKTKDFVRFRIGIGPKNKDKDLAEFVLKNFSRQEKEVLKEVFKKTIKGIEIALKKGIDCAASEINKN